MKWEKGGRWYITWNRRRVGGNLRMGGGREGALFSTELACLAGGFLPSLWICAGLVKCANIGLA